MKKLILLLVCMFPTLALTQVKGFPVSTEVMKACIKWHDESVELEKQFEKHFHVKHTEKSFNELLDTLLIKGLVDSAHADDCEEKHHKKKLKELKAEKVLLEKIKTYWVQAKPCPQFLTKDMEKLESVIKLYDK